MAKPKPSVNNIKMLCEAKGMSSLALAKKIGTSAPHMSRLMNGKSPLTMKWLLKISAVFKAPTHKVANLPKDGSMTGQCDDTLLGSIMGWLLEASDDLKVKLNRQEIARLTSFIYKAASERPLDFKEAQYLAICAIKIIRCVQR